MDSTTHCAEVGFTLFPSGESALHIWDNDVTLFDGVEGLGLLSFYKN